MYSLSENRTELFEQLKGLFVPEGFSWLKKQEIFWRKYPDGKHIIRFNIASYPNKYFALMVNIGIRHDVLQDTVERIGDFRVPSPDNKYIYTLGGELGNISRGSVYRWEISNLEEVNCAVNEISLLWKEIAGNFFTRFEKLEEIFQCLKSHDRASMILWGLPDVATCSAMVAAEMLHHQTDIQKIYDEALQRYGKSRQFEKDIVKRVYAYLTAPIIDEQTTT